MVFACFIVIHKILIRLTLPYIHRVIALYLYKPSNQYICMRKPSWLRLLKPLLYLGARLHCVSPQFTNHLLPFYIL